MENDFKVTLQPSDFVVCPVWRYDEDANAYLAVRDENDLPEQTRDLRIHTEFVTPSGEKIKGYIVGVDKVFSIGLFFGAQTYHANKNLYELSKGQIDEFLQASALASNFTFESLFPLNFETRWESETFKNFSGAFAMLPL